MLSGGYLVDGVDGYRFVVSPCPAYDGRCEFTSCGPFDDTGTTLNVFPFGVVELELSGMFWLDVEKFGAVGRSLFGRFGGNVDAICTFGPKPKTRSVILGTSVFCYTVNVPPG